MIAKLTLVFALATVSAALEEVCPDQATCETIPLAEALNANAMLQTKSSPTMAAVTQKSSLLSMQATHYQESRACLPGEIKKFHTSLLATGRQVAAPSASSLTEVEGHKACAGDSLQPGDACSLFDQAGTCSVSPRMELACNLGQWAACAGHMAGVDCRTSVGLTGTCQVGGVTPARGAPNYLTCEVSTLQEAAAPPAVQAPEAPAAPVPEAPAPVPVPEAPAAVPAGSGSFGATASLDAAGFLATTKLCCPVETEQFFNRLLESKGLDVCSKQHVQGLMHWFSCVPDMDIQYMIDVIDNGNPCKYWELKGTVCPTLSPQCAGKWCR